MSGPTIYCYICKFEGFNDQKYFYDEDTARRFVQDKVEKYRGVRGEVIPVASVAGLKSCASPDGQIRTNYLHLESGKSNSAGAVDGVGLVQALKSL